MKPAALERQARKAVDQFRTKLQQIAYEWDDLYTPMSTDCTDLERCLDDFEARIAEAVDYMKRPLGDDE